MKYALIPISITVAFAVIISIICYNNGYKEGQAEAAKINLVKSLTTPRQRPITDVIVDGDEMPGIGAAKEKPDTCIAYLDSNNIVHLKYAK